MKDHSLKQQRGIVVNIQQIWKRERDLVSYKYTGYTVSQLITVISTGVGPLITKLFFCQIEQNLLCQLGGGDRGI